ncbi:MAG TPA: hypothetical protein PLU11_13485, partial [Chitinophagaceae bacterium]|nr:hypothetical protein [Chitinophagaceae bacterium]
MNPCPVADDGDPAKRLTKTISSIAFLVIILVFTACADKAEQKPLPSPGQDSGYLKEKEKKRVDSLAALTRKKKKIYLTFDDGPNKGTRNVLEVIKT